MGFVHSSKHCEKDKRRKFSNQATLNSLFTLVGYLDINNNFNSIYFWMVKKKKKNLKMKPHLSQCISKGGTWANRKLIPKYRKTSSLLNQDKKKIDVTCSPEYQGHVKVHTKLFSRCLRLKIVYFCHHLEKLSASIRYALRHFSFRFRLSFKLYLMSITSLSIEIHLSNTR